MTCKRLIGLVMSAIILVSAYIPLKVNAAGLSVMVNNVMLASGTSPESYGGATMVPALELAKSMGGSFNYSSRDMTGTVRAGDNELVFRLDDSIAAYNGKNVQAPAPMRIMGYRFMIPAEFTAQKLGAEVRTHYTKGILMINQPVDGKLVYQVMPGDTLWIISQTFGVTVSSIKNLNGLTSDMLYIGQKLTVKNYVPEAANIAAYTVSGATIRNGAGFGFGIAGYLGTGASVTVTGKNGDWYRVSTARGNGYVYFTTIAINQDLYAGSISSKFFSGSIPIDTSMDSLTYRSYTVVRGDSIWSIASSNSLQDYELAEANNMSPYTVLYPGQTIRIPVHQIPEKKTLGPQYGEILDWFKEAQYVFPIGKTGKLTDVATGKSFNVKRTMGASHSDTETLTAQDSQVMKEIFGGSWIWTRRPFILEADGRRFAVSVAGMPHAGVDGAAYLQNVENRSDNYGYGPNYDAIAGNDMNGHFDMYFLNCIRHMDNSIDASHQYNVLVSGGLR